MNPLRALHGLCLLIGLLALPAGAAETAAASSIEIAGKVTQARQVDLAGLKALPPKTVTVTFKTGHGEQTGTYTGALLWDLLKTAGIVDEGKGSMLRQTIDVVGRDGYMVVLSLSEIDPDYGNNGALVAYARADGPQTGFRLIVPGDSHGGRAVNDVVKIDVK